MEVTPTVVTQQFRVRLRHLSGVLMGDDNKIVGMETLERRHLLKHYNTVLYFYNFCLVVISSKKISNRKIGGKKNLEMNDK